MLFFKIALSLLITTSFLPWCSVLFAKTDSIILTFESDGMTLEVEKMGEVSGVLWGLAFINSKEVLITKRSGSLFRYNLDTQKSVIIKNIPKVFASGEAGLLDVALSPDFSNSQRMYLTYVKKFPKGTTTTLATAVLVGNKLTKLREIFVANPIMPNVTHYGSRILIQKNFIYVSTGERGEQQMAQKRDNHHGKIIRLHLDGTVPKSNPFVGVKNAKPEIWTFGHRNPQGLAIHPKTGELWSGEHGPDGGDEINKIGPGKNYGWPVITHGQEYSGRKIGIGTAKKGMEQPVKYFSPSIAPSSLSIYGGKKFPQWYGHIFSTALRGMHLNKISLKGGRVIDEQRLLTTLGFRFRSIVQGPDELPICHLQTANSSLNYSSHLWDNT